MLATGEEEAEEEPRGPAAARRLAAPTLAELNPPPPELRTGMAYTVCPPSTYGHPFQSSNPLSFYNESVSSLIQIH